MGSAAASTRDSRRTNANGKIDINQKAPTLPKECLLADISADSTRQIRLSDEWHRDHRGRMPDIGSPPALLQRPHLTFSGPF